MTGLQPNALRRPLGWTTLVLLAALAVTGVLDPRTTLQAWHAATVFWTGIALGSLAVLMIHHLTSGAWGWYLRPILRAAAATVPLVLLAHVPLLAAMEALFPWTAPPRTLPEVVERKLAYLNVPFFLTRAILYAVVWAALARLLTPLANERRLALAASGLILYALTITFYGVDWIHSLEPRFYSSAVGYVMATGQFAAALAFALVMAAWLRPSASEGRSAPFHDVGNLLLAAVLLWTYIVFAKYLIIWMTDLPHEIEWYLRRQTGSWRWLTALLVALHFCLPFVLLLFRRVKQSRPLLAGVAGLLLIAHALDVFWLVLPSFDARPAYAGFVDLSAVAGLGGLWLLLFFSRLETLGGTREAAGERGMLDERRA